MAAEICDGHCLCRIACRSHVYVEACLRSALAQEEEGISGKNWVEVLACGVDQFLMPAGGRGIAPYVAGHRRCMVFAPYVLEAFDILVHHRTAVGCP